MEKIDKEVDRQLREQRKEKKMADKVYTVHTNYNADMNIAPYYKTYYVVAENMGIAEEKVLKRIKLVTDKEIFIGKIETTEGVFIRD